jgi:DNA-binding beta-propeller fold protein YncE
MMQPSSRARMITAASNAGARIGARAAALMRPLIVASACVLSMSIDALAAGAWVNGQAANVVLGQPNFQTTSMALSASVFDHVGGIAVDPSTGKVFVVDSSSSRVMRFSSVSAAQSGSAAEAWFGQPNPNTGAFNSTSIKTFFIPEQIHIDSGGRLWVADRENHRVLRFDNASTKASFADADGVLGQATFIGGSANRGGPVASNTLNKPLGVFHDGLVLWVADGGNHRVVGYALPHLKANGAVADVVFGQPNMNGSASGTSLAQMNAPSAVVVANGALYVADRENNRVLRFDGAVTKPAGAPADGRLGLAGAPGPTTMDSPNGLAADSTGRLYVSDSGFNRVLIFNGAAQKPNGAAADNVLGQPDFKTIFNSGVVGLGARNLNRNSGLAFDNALNVLWVGDYNNSRALRFSPVVAVLDVDLSGDPTKYHGPTDGLLILRHLFGLSGTNLTAGATASTAARAAPAAVKSYLDEVTGALDIDNDGKADALTDGLLILRYLHGLRGAALTVGAVAPGATRNTAATIEPYIQLLMQ